MSQSQQPTPDSQANSPMAEQDGRGPTSDNEETDMLNPLFDKQSERQKAAEPGFIGEASCAAFNNRLLQCLDENYTPSTAGFSNYYRLPATRRLPIHGHDHTLDDTSFPERMHAKLLLNVARNFIGNYHPLFLEKAFMKEIDAFYRQELNPSQLWLCKFLTLMALGEIYTNRRKVGDSNRVPGTSYYMRALHMLPDSYEEPSLIHVEVLTLLVCLFLFFRADPDTDVAGLGGEYLRSRADGILLQRHRATARYEHRDASICIVEIYSNASRARSPPPDMVGGLLLRPLLRLEARAASDPQGRGH